jgi:hypothetical protein
VDLRSCLFNVIAGAVNDPVNVRVVPNFEELFEKLILN